MDFFGDAIDRLPFSADFAGREIYGGSPNIGDGYLGALGRQFQRRCAADATHAAGAGDQSYFAFQAHGCSLPALKGSRANTRLTAGSKNSKVRVS